MVKYLDNSLSVHALFHKAGYICQRHLLADKILSTVPTDLSGNKSHNKNNCNSQNCQKRTQCHHGNKSDNNGKKGHQRLGNCLADHLSQSVGIVCVKTHNRAVCPLVKIADRKSLHMFKHIVSHLFQNTLSDINHHSGVNKGGNHSQKENASQNCKRPVKLCKVRTLLSDQRNNKIIQQKFQGQRYGDRCHRADKNTDKHQDKTHFIGFCHIFQKALCCL